MLITVHGGIVPGLGLITTASLVDLLPHDEQV